MNTFRLVLCIAGLLTYLAAKQLTAPPDEASGSPRTGNHVLGVALSFPQPDPNPATLALESSTSSNTTILQRVRSESALPILSASTKATLQAHPGPAVTGSKRLAGN